MNRLLMGLFAICGLGSCGGRTPEEICALHGMVPTASREACMCPDASEATDDGLSCVAVDGGVPIPNDGGFSAQDAGHAGADAGTDACQERPFFLDYDSDGFGDFRERVTACQPPIGYVANGDDCDDDCHSCHPGAVEVCDGKDNNCDRRTDEYPAVERCGSPERVFLVGCEGACVILECQAGVHLDCDGIFENGCEQEMGGRIHCLECNDNNMGGWCS